MCYICNWRGNYKLNFDPNKYCSYKHVDPSECYSYKYVDSNKCCSYKLSADLQKSVFIRQLKIALELNMPLVIHCREAQTDCLQILEKVIHPPAEWNLWYSYGNVYPLLFFTSLLFGCCGLYYNCIFVCKSQCMEKHL